MLTQVETRWGQKQWQIISKTNQFKKSSRERFIPQAMLLPFTSSGKITTKAILSHLPEKRFIMQLWLHVPANKFTMKAMSILFVRSIRILLKQYRKDHYKSNADNFCQQRKNHCERNIDSICQQQDDRWWSFIQDL